MASFKACTILALGLLSKSIIVQAITLSTRGAVTSFNIPKMGNSAPLNITATSSDELCSGDYENNPGNIHVAVDLDIDVTGPAGASHKWESSMFTAGLQYNMRTIALSRALVDGESFSFATYNKAPSAGGIPCGRNLQDKPDFTTIHSTLTPMCVSFPGDPVSDADGNTWLLQTDNKTPEFTTGFNCISFNSLS